MEFTGKTIEQAIKEGLDTLGATLDQVDVKIINDGGLFKKAKIEMTRAKEESATKKEKPKTQEIKETKKETPVPVEEKDTSEKETTVSTTNTQLTEEKQTTTVSKEEIEKMVADVKVYIKEYLDKMCYLFNKIGDVEIKEVGRDLHVNLKSNIRQMIGYHGDSLDAYQFLLTSAVNNHFPHFRGRIYLDVDSYKANREATLTNLAKRMANKVVVARRSMKLEPMRSYERKVIHNVLTGMDHISTHSEGEEPKRYIVIDYVEDTQN